MKAIDLIGMISMHNRMTGVAPAAAFVHSDDAQSVLDDIMDGGVIAAPLSLCTGQSIRESDGSVQRLAYSDDPRYRMTLQGVAVLADDSHRPGMAAFE